MPNAGYSPIQHLADALFFNHDPRERFFVFMMQYTAYMDASGDRSIPMMAVCALISSVDDWKQFEKDWSAVLAWAKVPYFHMKRFTVSREPFENQKWKREEYRKEFLQRLIKVINKLDKCCLSLLPMQDWQTVNKEYCMKEALLTPFSVASCGALLGAEEWCRIQRVPWEHLKVLFEDGDTDKGHFIDWSKKAFRKTPIPLPGIPDEGSPVEAPTVPFQACDFIAWEARRAENDCIGDPSVYALRKSFSQFLDTFHHDDDHERWNVENLRGLCVKHNIRKR